MRSYEDIIKDNLALKNQLEYLKNHITLEIEQLKMVNQEVEIENENLKKQLFTVNQEKEKLYKEVTQLNHEVKHLKNKFSIKNKMNKIKGVIKK